MGNTKFAVTDPEFLQTMLSACDKEEERGLVLLLYDSGMHISSAVKLKIVNLMREGPNHYIVWKRTKTEKAMQARLPEEHVNAVQAFIQSPKKSLRTYFTMLKVLGAIAGYDNISQQTFRHTRCLNLLRGGMPLVLVAQMMGCSEDVVTRAYAKLSEEDLKRLRM